MKNTLNKFHSFCLKYHLYYYLGMVLLFAFDIATKYSFEALLLANDGRIEVIPGFFDLALLYNPGAFSGMLGGSLGGKIVLNLLSLGCGVAMIFGFVKYYNKICGFERAGLLMAIPGTLGNLVDRFLMLIGKQEGVIDFLEFDLGFMVWNTFNIADALLVAGLITFAVGLLVRGHKEDKEKKLLEAQGKVVDTQVEEEKEPVEEVQENESTEDKKND